VCPLFLVPGFPDLVTEEPVDLDNRPLRRREAAQFLTDHGFTTAPATLAKLATVGGGPLFHYWGRFPIYSPCKLLEWAHARSTGPRRSTADRGEIR
jgi:hypothetical protein